jgi:hypothetical protein
MLTADLVRLRRDRQTGDLQITPLSGKQQERALELAEAYLALVRGHIGRTREELEEALAQVPCSPRERLIAEGLRKLIEDRCEFDVSAEMPPEELRADVFLRAAAQRRAGATASSFDRDAVLREVAAARGLILLDDPGGGDAVARIERCLYADLRGAHVLKEVAPLLARALVEGYDMAQAQAVLLRAVRIRVEVRCASAGAYRALFRRLKFLRLLCTITPIGQPLANDEGYRIEIDGPFSLFESVTKYGLQLALALPVIAACDEWSLTAQVQWGKERQPGTFRLEGMNGIGVAQEADPEAALPDEVRALLRGFQGLSGPWTASVATALLPLPGVGVCVPDLVFHHKERGLEIHLEVLGYWSREAVWRRVELVEQGLRHPVLFAVSSRLRVSEEALGEDLPAALYVYKGVMSPKAVQERLDKLAARL